MKQLVLICAGKLKLEIKPKAINCCKNTKKPRPYHCFNSKLSRSHHKPLGAIYTRKYRELDHQTQLLDH
jgi:hypothetical protein